MAGSSLEDKNYQLIGTVLDILPKIAQIVDLFGYGGVAFLMLLENVIPPIPSEIIMPLAGFAVARGEMNLFGVIAAGTMGSVLGALIWYYIGKSLGFDRICQLADQYGKWWGISSKEVMGVQAWFSDHSGYGAVGFGRLIPGVRTYVSVPAGVVGMDLGRFLLASTVGSLGWITLLTLAGAGLGEQYDRIADFLEPISKVILVSLIALPLVTLGYQWKKRIF